MPGADVHLYILKEYGFTHQMLTYCINGILFRGLFPESLKFAKIMLVNKKDEATDKENYTLVSVLPLFSKIFEKSFL